MGRLGGGGGLIIETRNIFLCLSGRKEGASWAYGGLEETLRKEEAEGQAMKEVTSKRKEGESL